MTGSPFTYPRRVAFGECDPARIFFAPRAFDYAVEAVEAWFESALGVSWAELQEREGLEARFLLADCEYAKSVVAGQVVDVAIGAAEAAGDRLLLGAVGAVAGEPSFRARFEMGLVDRARAAPVEIPARYRERVESYQAACLPPARREDPAAPPEPAPEGPPLPPPGAAPFRLSRRVTSGDCSIAGSAYAPRVAAWAVEAAGEWYQATLGISWLEQCRRGRGAPFVRIRCQYLRPMAPGQIVEVEVRIPRLGRASIGYQVLGLDAGGAPCFEAQMTACYVSDEGGRAQAMPFPEELRRRIVAYQAAARGAP